jgi:hypothetical protein
MWVCKEDELIYMLCTEGNAAKNVSWEYLLLTITNKAVLAREYSAG